MTETANPLRSAGEIRGSSPLVAIENESAPQLIVDQPLPGPLAARPSSSPCPIEITPPTPGEVAMRSGTSGVVQRPVEAKHQSGSVALFSRLRLAGRGHPQRARVGTIQGPRRQLGFWSFAWCRSCACSSPGRAVLGAASASPSSQRRTRRASYGEDRSPVCASTRQMPGDAPAALGDLHGLTDARPALRRQHPIDTPRSPQAPVPTVRRQPRQPAPDPPRAAGAARTPPGRPPGARPPLPSADARPASRPPAARRDPTVRRTQPPAGARAR